MRRTLLIVAAFALGLVTYLPSVTHGFVWDDRTLIAENRFIHDTREWGRSLTGDFFRRSGEPTTIGHWRPLVTASYLLDWKLGGGSPRSFHVTNAILHGTATALVLFLAISLGLGEGAAFLAALLFAAQPSHVEAVSWISGRTDLLCGVFVLAALALDARDADRGGWASRIGGPIATLAALLAKEMAVIVPIAVAFRALLLPGGRPATRTRWREALRAAWPHLAVIALYAVIRLEVLGIVPQLPRAAQAGRVALFWTWWSAFLEYARVLAWPSTLSIVPRVSLATSPAAPRVALGIALFAVLVVAAWRTRRVAPVIGWGLSCFLASFAPLVNFLVPVRAISSVVFPWAERFLFVPTLFLSIAAAGLLDLRFPRSRPGRVLAASGLAVVVIALGARTLRRETVWHSQRTLFTATVDEAPDHAPSLVALGTALLDDGDLVGAEERFRQALAISPGDAFGLFNLGNLLRQRGDLDGAERAYRAALAVRPQYAQALLNLGLVEAASGRLDAADETFRAADAALGGYPEAKVNLAIVMRLRGRPDEARRLYEQALEIDPSLAAARAGLDALRK